MKKYTMLMVVCVLPFYLNAQNLVPNWSFEDTVACPFNYNQLLKSTGWFSFRNSPDYFNSCSTNLVGVPNNDVGFQNARTGNAYSGLICYPIYREWLGIHLIQPLIVGENYNIRFFANLSLKANASGFHYNTGINHLGLRFSTVSYSNGGLLPLNGFDHIHTDSIINDTLAWFEIKGNFIADSSYNYLIIGNFFNDSLTSFYCHDSSFGYSYYYIDDVSIEKALSVVETSEDDLGASIFPNPTFGLFTVKTFNNNKVSISIFSDSGKIIFKINPEKLETILNLTDFKDGVYLVLINDNKNYYLRKIIKTTQF